MLRNRDDIFKVTIHERGGDERAVEIQSILAYGWILRLRLGLGLHSRWSWMHPVVFVCAGGLTRGVGWEQPASTHHHFPFCRQCRKQGLVLLLRVGTTQQQQQYPVCIRVPSSFLGSTISNSSAVKVFLPSRYPSRYADLQHSRLNLIYSLCRGLPWP